MENYIVLGLNEGKYALSISEIQEIIKLQPITEVPCGKMFVKGVINLRGRIVPVISLSARFGVREAEPGASARIVIVSSDTEDIGIRVDSVDRVAIFDELLPPAVDSTGDATRDCLSGIGRLGDTLISILDLQAVLGLRGGV